MLLAAVIACSKRLSAELLLTYQANYANLLKHDFHPLLYSNYPLLNAKAFLFLEMVRHYANRHIAVA